MISYKINNNGLYCLQHNYPKLGYPINSVENDIIKNKIPLIINNGIIIYSPTAFGIGDSVVLTSLPRILKSNYPNIKFYLLGEKSLFKLFGHMKIQWDSWKNPFENVELCFRNNPYIDGYLELEDFEGDVFTSHDVIYDPNNKNEPIIKQICRFFNIKNIKDEDIPPELYFSEKEKFESNEIKEKIKENYGVVIISNRYVDDIEYRKSLQFELNKFKNLPFIYFDKTSFFEYNKKINVLDENINIRTQLKIFSEATVCLGFQTGVLDAVCRYTDVRVLPHSFYSPRDWQYQPNIKYLSPV